VSKEERFRNGRITIVSPGPMPSAYSTSSPTELHCGEWQGVEPEEYIQFLNLTLWDTYQILASLPPLPAASGSGGGGGGEASNVKRAAAEVAEELRGLGLGGNANGTDQGEVELELQGEAASEEEAAAVRSCARCSHSFTCGPSFIAVKPLTLSPAVTFALSNHQVRKLMEKLGGTTAAAGGAGGGGSGMSLAMSIGSHRPKAKKAKTTRKAKAKAKRAAAAEALHKGCADAPLISTSVLVQRVAPLWHDVLSVWVSRLRVLLLSPGVTWVG